MHTQSRARILERTCTALALLLAVASTVAGARPARHGPPPPSHSSGQTITLYTTGVTSPKTTAYSSQHAVFTNQGPIDHDGGWLRALTRPGAFRPGTVTIIDDQLRGRKEFGLPLEGRLQGVLVTTLADSSSHMVAVKASFAGSDGEDGSLRFFGVRRDDREESQIAVVGGTGQYSGATGFAVLKAAGSLKRVGMSAWAAHSVSVRMCISILK